MTDEQKSQFVQFRLMGITSEWAVYWVFWRPDMVDLYLEQCRVQDEPWNYYRRAKCHILSEEMVQALKELQE